MERFIMTAAVLLILLLNFYTLSTTIENLRLSSESAQNATNRAQNATLQRLALLDRQSAFEHAVRTDYAWHFNQGHKLDMLIDDINEIKSELGIGDNFTYAGPGNTKTCPRS